MGIPTSGRCPLRFSGLVTVLCIFLLWTGFAVSWPGQETVGRSAELLPNGEAEELTRRLCGSCHSLGNLTGLRQSYRSWESVVGRMINLGAPVRGEEFSPIVRYLAEVFGPDSPPRIDLNQAGAEELKKLAGLDDLTIRKLLYFRDQKGGFDSSEQVRGIIDSDMFDRLKGYLWAGKETAVKSVELLPDGEGAELTRGACSGCHSLLTFTGLRRDPRGWEDIVRMMMIDHGAPIQSEQSRVIIRYLTDVFGPDSPPLTDIKWARAEDLKKLPGLDDLTARRLLDFRDQKGGFNSVDQIREVIGSDRFDKLKGYLIVR